MKTQLYTSFIPSTNQKWENLTFQNLLNLYLIHQSTTPSNLILNTHTLDHFQTHLIIITKQ